MKLMNQPFNSYTQVDIDYLLFNHKITIDLEINIVYITLHTDTGEIWTGMSLESNLNKALVQIRKEINNSITLFQIGIK